jgi:hypothetical protein
MQTTEMNSMIFGQHDPGKTPKGKTSEEEFIMEFLRKNYSRNYKYATANLSQVWLPISPWNLCLQVLEVCALFSLEIMPFL